MAVLHTTFAKFDKIRKLVSDNDKYSPNVSAHFTGDDNVRVNVEYYSSDHEWFIVSIRTSDHDKNPDGAVLDIYLDREQLAQLGSVIAKEVNRHSIP